MKPLTTDIGKIYYYYDEKDAFVMMRLIDIVKNEQNTEYHFCKISEENNYEIDLNNITIESQEYFENIKKNWYVLKSDGILGISNIISIETIRDVIAIFYPNNKATGVPVLDEPYVVARQGINNIFDTAGDSVGLSVSLDTMPDGYTLEDFMEHVSILSSKMCNVYKTDTEKNLEIILNNDETNQILKDLYGHQYQFMKNTVKGFEEKVKECKLYQECLNGYNTTISGFLKNTECISDIARTIGITTVELFSIENNKKLSDDNKLLVSKLYNLKIDKAGALKFDYSIDLSSIKRMYRMNYVLVRDSKTGILWIIPYTEFEDQTIDLSKLYDLTDEEYAEIQRRIRNI